MPSAVADVFPSEAIALGQAEPHLAKLLHLAKRDLRRGRFLQRRAQAELAAQATAPKLSIARHCNSRQTVVGIGIDYSKPGSIGADRLANAMPRRRVLMARWSWWTPALR